MFTLAEGDVTLRFPADLSGDSYDELSDYLEVFLRSAKRKAAQPKVAPQKTMDEVLREQEEYFAKHPEERPDDDDELFA